MRVMIIFPQKASCGARSIIVHLREPWCRRATVHHHVGIRQMWLQCNLLSRQRICAISSCAATICHVAFAPLRLRACLLQILTVSDAAFREPSAGLSARSSFICVDEDSAGLARLNSACLFVCLFVRFAHGLLADSQFPLCACLSACASASASASGNNFAILTLLIFVVFFARIAFRFHVAIDRSAQGVVWWADQPDNQLAKRAANEHPIASFQYKGQPINVLSLQQHTSIPSNPPSKPSKPPSTQASQSCLFLCLFVCVFLCC